MELHLNNYIYYTKMNIISLTYDDIERANSGNYFTGKYLFFSANRDDLINFGKEFLMNSETLLFRINSNNCTSGDDFDNVLAIYDVKPRYTFLLEDLIRNKYPNLIFRYWKSMIKSSANIYSPQFLNKILNGT